MTAPNAPENTTTRLWQRASQGLFLLAILLLAGHLVVYVHYAVGLMRFPFDYDQGEGFELVDTILFSEGEWPYRNNEVYPYYASNYPPLFHVILVPFVWLFGEAYWYGRLGGFLGTLVTAGTIGYVVQREGHHRPLAILSGLAFLASNYVYHVGPLFRQHMTMVMFETLGVAVLAHVMAIDDPRRRRRVMIAGLLLLLAAGYTKQLALASCVAAFGWLFIRNPRRSLAWGLIFGTVAGALFLWIDLSTGGEWWKNIIAANVNEYYFGQFTGLFRQWLRLHGALIVLAAVLVAYELYFARLSLYSVWWVLAIANSVLAGKWGAGDSYFATAIAATCILAGIAAARTVRGTWHFPPDHPFVRRADKLRAAAVTHRRALLAVAGLVIPALYLAYGLSVVKMPTEGRVFGTLADTLELESSYGTRYAFYDSAGWTEGYATIGHVPTQQDIDNGWRIVDILRASDRPAMSEEAAFSLEAGKEVVTNPTQLKNLHENDQFDPANLVADLRAQRFGVIVFRAQFYPLPVLDAVYEAYYPADMIPMNGFNYEIWRPGPPEDERARFAAGLAALTPSTAFTQTLNLSLDAAQRWLAHALIYRDWEPGEPASAPPGGADCRAETYQRLGETLAVMICSQNAGSEIVLSINEE
jgi:hypothetical protein